MRKAQAAMEYLMTYGWAILIVVVVVAALYAMGVFKIGGGGVPCSPCFSYFAYVDYTPGAGAATGTLKLRNGPQQINITSATDEGNDISANLAGCTQYASCDSGKDITLTGIGSTSGSTRSIVITYTVIASGLSHTDTATIHNP